MVLVIVSEPNPRPQRGIDGVHGACHFMLMLRAGYLDTNSLDGATVGASLAALWQSAAIGAGALYQGPSVSLWLKISGARTTHIPSCSTFFTGRHFIFCLLLLPGTIRPVSIRNPPRIIS